MISIEFGETKNGYPTITLLPPYDPFAEFLRTEHSVERARRVLGATDSVLVGGENHAEIMQDYGLLTLDRRQMNARVWLDNYLSTAIERESDLPLQEFRDVAAAWLSYLEKRPPTA